ncbi:hypothetical protein ACL6C3_08180 [Capilliphycus salinus ALCB114379]|uniref:hypothetical protein n=1 Tax=Capilliphycus salinus TaxID=2768948 RepID=UPI0039A4EDB1
MGQSTTTKPEENQQKSANFKLNLKQKNWLVSLQVATAGIELGTGFCMVIKALRAGLFTQPF